MQANEQQKARIASMMKTWERRKKISQNLSRIRHKIAVYSGKGGVGKTTVAVNMAALLALQSHKVGLLDADVDCPNAERVLGTTTRPTYHDGIITPTEREGVKIISMSSFQEKEDEAIIWRGPMISNALNQFLEMTDWGELDYLVVDLPPGTSDSPLTVMQTLQLDGVIVVTTPQELAALDARRSINMIKKLNVDVLGVVENMAGDVFGKGGGERLARDLELPFLGRLEMAKEFGEMGSDIAVLKHKKVRERYQGIVEGAIKRLEDLASAVTN